MKAAIYCRVSTEDQKDQGTSLETQEEDCLAKARELGYAVPPELLLEADETGMKFFPPVRKHVLEMIRAKAMDAVICWAPHRLSRLPDERNYIGVECEMSRVKLIYCYPSPTTGDPDTDKKLDYEEGLGHKKQVLNIVKWTSDGRKATAQGKKKSDPGNPTIPSGCLARRYGYTYSAKKRGGDGKRHIDPVTSKAVIDMFEWCRDEHLSTWKIAERLMQKHIPNPTGGKVWHKRTVYDILTSKAYVGKTFYNTSYHYTNPDTGKSKIVMRPEKEWVDVNGVTPPIISPELFEAVQAVLSENTTLHAGDPTRDYLLHGLVQCAVCERPFYVSAVRDSYRYRCSSRWKHTAPKHCGIRTLDGPKFETEVWEDYCKIIRRISKDPPAVKMFIRPPRRENLAPQLEAVDKRLNQHDVKKKRAYQAMLSDGDEAQYRNTLAHLERQIAKDSAEKAGLQKRLIAQNVAQSEIEALVASAKEMAEKMPGMDFVDKRAWLLKHNAQVRVLTEGFICRIHLPVETPCVQSW